MNAAIPYLGETLSIITAVIWAMAVILFKKSGESVHPIGLNIFKNILAFLLFIPTLFLFGESFFREVPASDYWLLLLSGVIGIGIADTLFFKSLNLLGAGLVAIVSCMYAPTIILLSFLTLDESLSWIQIVGVIMIVAAVLTAVSKKSKVPISRRNLMLGLLWGILGSIGTGVSIVMIKRLLEESPVIWVTEVRLLGGILSLLVILLLHPGRRKIIASLRTSKSWVYTLSSSFVGAYLAMIFWLAGMKFTQASTASALNQTSNIFIFIFAWLFLREPVNVLRTIGILLGVIGALLVTFGS
jgi:drug/metabolite transporter (DMT)-like permease